MGYNRLPNDDKMTYTNLRKEYAKLSSEYEELKAEVEKLKDKRYSLRNQLADLEDDCCSAAHDRDYYSGEIKRLRQDAKAKKIKIVKICDDIEEQRILLERLRIAYANNKDEAAAKIAEEILSSIMCNGGEKHRGTKIFEVIEQAIGYGYKRGVRDGEKSRRKFARDMAAMLHGVYETAEKNMIDEKEAAVEETREILRRLRKGGKTK